jgi:hypothetical protein
MASLRSFGMSIPLYIGSALAENAAVVGVSTPRAVTGIETPMSFTPLG